MDPFPFPIPALFLTFARRAVLFQIGDVLMTFHLTPPSASGFFLPPFPCEEVFSRIFVSLFRTKKLA